jgi:DNA invertase Pin-like site-specific DNA recombinase
MADRRRRALGYTRVSTVEQADAFGLAAQEAAIQQHCRSEGLRLVDVVSDEGASGSNGLESREGLAAAVARLEVGEADVLVVARVDRLARDLVLQETILERLRQGGFDVQSVAEPDLTGDDPTRVLIRQVLGAIAQYERGVIRARMMAGKAVKRARGGYTGGRPPYGQRAEQGRLVADEAEASSVRRIHDLRDEGLSLRQIASVLDREGFRPKGKSWHPATVARLIERLPETATRSS